MLHLIMLKEIEIVGSFQFNREFEEAVQLDRGGQRRFRRADCRRIPSFRKLVTRSRSWRAAVRLGKSSFWGP